ncbi:MAG: hypothetical protein ACK55I_44790 [bacterium]
MWVQRVFLSGRGGVHSGLSLRRRELLKLVHGRPEVVFRAGCQKLPHGFEGLDRGCLIGRDRAADGSSADRRVLTPAGEWDRRRDQEAAEGRPSRERRGRRKWLDEVAFNGRGHVFPFLTTHGQAQRLRRSGHQPRKSEVGGKGLVSRRFTSPTRRSVEFGGTANIERSALPARRCRALHPPSRTEEHPIASEEEPIQRCTSEQQLTQRSQRYMHFE